MSLPPYRKIDQSTWSRQDHYKYYTEKLKVNYSMTARLDVTRLRAECDRFECISMRHSSGVRQML